MSTIKQKIGICVDCGAGSNPQALIAKRCKNHYWKYREEVNKSKVIKRTGTSAIKKARKPIPMVSKKRAVESAKYTVAKIQFMSKPENKACPVTGQPTIDIHHKMGRIGFADSWARINNVTLLLDTRFWLAVSRAGHQQIEENPSWAKEMGYSLSRI